jgi:hypothetical protein
LLGKKKMLEEWTNPSKRTQWILVNVSPKAGNANVAMLPELPWEHK